MSATAVRYVAIDAALADLRQGRMLVVVNEGSPEDEGNLIMAAQFVTSASINFMAKHARGLICLALTGERCEQLGLRLMVAKNQSAFQPAFTVSIEARTGVTTGISAADRARTIGVAIDPASSPRDLVQPGHVFPLRARDGGVLARVGHAEAATDLARLAGLPPAGVICQILNEDGTIAQLPDLQPYCERHGLKLVAIADLVAHLRRAEKLVERVVSTRLPTGYGDFHAVGYRSRLDGTQHVALVKGVVAGARDVLVRVHSGCLAGDVFHSRRCDCGERLRFALSAIEREGRGVLLYLNTEARGAELLDCVRGHELDAAVGLAEQQDLRDHGVGAQILIDLGISSVRIPTNARRSYLGSPDMACR